MTMTPPPTIHEMLVHAPFVRAVARAAVCGDHQVDDVVQATWLAAVQQGPRHGGAVRGWLATVARNVARTAGRGESRRQQREQAAAQAEGLPSTDEIAAKEEIRQQLVGAVLELREPYRSAILLRYYENLPPRQVAARMGVPLETARTQVRRGLNLLRGRLDAQHAGERRGWAVAASGLVGTGGAITAGGLLGVGLGKVAAVAAVAAVLIGVGVLAPSGDDTPIGGTDAEPALVAETASAALHGWGERSEGTGTIQGIVRLPEGMERARVDVYRHMGARDLWSGSPLAMLRSPMPAGAPWGTVSVAADGAFQLSSVPDGVYQVWGVLPDGFTDVGVALVDPLMPPQHVSLDLVRGAHALHGRITYAGGEPFRGLVTLANPRAGMAMLGMPGGPPPIATDSEGRFAFEGLRPTTAALAFVEPGMRVERRSPVRIPHSGAFDVVLDVHRSRLHGRIVNALDRTPVVGAWLLVVEGGERSSSMRRVRPNAKGQFDMPVQGAVINLVAGAAGFASTSLRQREFEGEVTLELAPLVHVHGRVVSKADGTPVSGVTIHTGPLKRRDGINFGPGAEPPRSAADGTFTLTVEPGEFMVWAQGAGWMSPALPEVSKSYNPLARTARPGERIEVRVVVVRASRIEGTITTTSGDPVAGAVVAVDGMRHSSSQPWRPRPPGGQAVTDEAGHYVLETVEPGTDLRLQVRSAGHAPTRSDALAVTFGEQRTVNVTLPTARFIDVLVLDEHDEPVSGARLTVYRKTSGGGWRGRFGAVTSATGTVQLGPLDEGDTHYRVGSEGLIEQRKQQPLPKPGSGRIVRLRVRRGASIKGHVLGPAGLPLAGLRVNLESKSRVPWTHERVRTEADGAFHFSGLPAGAFELRTSAKWQGERWLGRATCDAGESSLRLALVREEKKQSAPTRDGWELRLHAPDGTPVHSAWSWRHGEREFQAGVQSLGGGSHGTTRFIGLDSQVKRMWVEVFRFADRSKVRLDFAPQLIGPLTRGDPGGPIDVRLQPGTAIAGRIVDAGGGAVAGVLISAHAHYEIGVVSSEEHGAVRTDTEGRFEIRGLGRFDYELRLGLAERHAPALPVRASFGARNVVVRVREAKTVTLKIVDYTGEPLPRARISVRLRSDVDARRSNPRGVYVQSDHRGNARLVSLDAAERYELVIQPPHGTEHALELKIPEWRPAKATLTLPRGYIIAGHVRSPGGDPIAGAAVFREIMENGFTTAITDADGSFRFTRLPRGPQRLVVSSAPRIQPHIPGLASRVVAAGNLDVRFTLRPSPQITLKFPSANPALITLTDTSAKGATPVTEPRLGSTNPFIVRGLRADAIYSVWVRPLGAGRGGYLAAGVRPGETREVVFTQGSRMRVTLRLPGPLPAGVTWKNAVVRAIGVGWEGRGRLRPDAPGEFEVTGLLGDPYRIEVTLEHWDGKGFVSPRFEGSAEVENASDVIIDLVEKR